MKEIQVEVTDEEMNLLIFFGFWKKGKDGVLELTPQGSERLKEWCRKKIEEHQTGGK